MEASARASQIYELRYRAAPRRGRVLRRVGQLLAFLADVGPVPAGGESVSILERRSGRTVGSVSQRFADEFYAVRIEEDLLVLSAEEFRRTWVGDHATRL